MFSDLGFLDLNYLLNHKAQTFFMRHQMPDHHCPLSLHNLLRIFPLKSKFPIINLFKIFLMYYQDGIQVSFKSIYIYCLLGAYSLRLSLDHPLFSQYYFQLDLLSKWNCHGGLDYSFLPSHCWKYMSSSLTQKNLSSMKPFLILIAQTQCSFPHVPTTQFTPLMLSSLAAYFMLIFWLDSKCGEAETPSFLSPLSPSSCRISHWLRSYLGMRHGEHEPRLI